MNRQCVAIFGANSSSKPFAASTRMVELLRKYGQDDYKLLYYEDVVFELKTGSALGYVVHNRRKVPLEDFNTIYLRSIEDELVRAAIAQYCLHRGVRVLNSENTNLPLTSKLSQYMAASFSGVEIPKSFFCLRPKHWQLAVDFFGDSADSYVIKSIVGSNGHDNIKVSRPDAEYDLGVPSIIQEYIANDYEYRIIVIDGQVALAYKKVNTGKTYQNNISRGGERQLVSSVPTSARDIAIKMAALTHREVSGIDVVCGRDEVHRFFEVNYSYGHPTGIQEGALERYGKALSKMLHIGGVR